MSDTNFPNYIDSLFNPTPVTEFNDPVNPHHLIENRQNDAIEALETTVGVNNSPDPNSLQYKVNHSAASTSPNNDSSTYLDGTLNWSHPPGSIPYTGGASIQISGSAVISLQGDAASPPSGSFYGVNPGGGGKGFFAVSFLSLSNVPATFAPSLHAAAHQAAGGDALALDTLAPPSDNTNLNASQSAHGLLSKLPGGTSTFLRADGSWAAPPGATYAGINSIVITGSNIALVNDLAAPGNDKVYGTTASGILGWRSSSGLPIAYGSLTGVPATFAPSAHAASHVTGSDQIVSAGTGGRGLLGQLSGNTTDYVGGDNACHVLPGRGKVVIGDTITDPSGLGIVVPCYVSHPDAIWAYNAFDDHFDNPASGAPNAKWVVGGPTAGMVNTALTQGGSELLISGMSGTGDSTVYAYSVQQTLPNHNPFTLSCKAEVDAFAYPNAASPNNVFAAGWIKLMDNSGNFGAAFQLFSIYEQSGQPWYAYRACQIQFGSGFASVLTYGLGGWPRYFRFVFLASNALNLYGSLTGRTWYPFGSLTGAQTGFASNPPAWFAFQLQTRWFSQAALQSDWVRFTNP